MRGGVIALSIALGLALAAAPMAAAPVDEAPPASSGDPAAPAGEADLAAGAEGSLSDLAAALECPTPHAAGGGLCIVVADCSGAGGGRVRCEGSCSNSFAIDDCYAYCDGDFYWCPDPPLPCATP